jgi:hypothetical protein
MANGAFVNTTTTSAGNLEWSSFGFCAALIADTMLVAALYRGALRARGAGVTDLGVGPLGLQWRAAEWRVLAVRALIYLLIVALLVLALVVFGVALVVFDPGVTKGGLTGPQLMSGPNPVILIAILFAFLVALVWLGARLALAPVIAVAEGRIALGRSFRITRGHVWPILGAGLMLGLILGLVLVVALVASAALRSIGVPDTGRWVGRAIVALGGGAFEVPASAGLAAYVYLRLCAVPSEASVFD